jgi:hypothetical protein
MVKRAGYPKDVHYTDLIAYWQARLKGTQYQRLARMALDLLTIPPIPKRIFSLTGANRARLRPNIIGASMAVGSWDKEGITNIVNGQLKRPQKEGTGHTR